MQSRATTTRLYKEVCSMARLKKLKNGTSYKFKNRKKALLSCPHSLQFQAKKILWEHDMHVVGTKGR